MTDFITPPPDLVQQLRKEAPHGIRDAGVTRELHLITAAYRAGANQELEACISAILSHPGFEQPELFVEVLCAARRPKPPSLKERALKILEEEPEADDMKELIVFDTAQVEIIRRALEQLND